MATISFNKDLDSIRDHIRSYLETSGETVTSFASRCDVPRDFLYRFMNENYKHSPSFEYVCRMIYACGKTITVTDME